MVTPLTAKLIDGWFRASIKVGALPDTETCEHIATELNKVFFRVQPIKGAFNPSSDHAISALPANGAALKRRRDAIRVIRKAITPANPEEFFWSPDEIHAFKKLTEALSHAEPFLVGETVRGRPTGSKGRPWAIIAIVSGAVAQGVLLEIGHKTAGLNRVSKVAKFVECVVAHFGFSAEREAIASLLEETLTED